MRCRISHFACACFLPLLLLPLSAAPNDRREARWRATIRDVLLIPNPLPPLAARTHGRFEPAPGVTAERVTYGTQFGMLVPAVLYLPRHAAGCRLARASTR
ncbi:MAG: hypothetical protein HYS05_21875, partial [Acidobacteria bacterium]|nr:hypothetical protein [Acidobacteriota bacterium]